MKRNTFWSLRLSQILLALLCVGSLSTFPRAQHATQTALGSNVSEDRVALHQALLDLTNPWTVMCIAAHPDDEDGTSLIVMRHKYGAHTVSLFSTFGEGGQNAIGPELYEELGAIRVRETMAAAEIQGSEPHFLGLKDFGYSKSADEAFRIWGHDEALRRMVLQIRKLRPDVIITNHSATSNDHGHHQVTARLELEAFEAAADAKRFPEQLKDGITVWQVQRLFVRAGRANQAQPVDVPLVTIDPNERDPIRGTTYAEEALRALHQHATQGPWPKTVADMARFRNSPDGKLPLIRYALARQAKGAEALTKDSHNFLNGLRLPEKVAREIELPTINDRPLVESLDKRSLVLEKLIEGYRQGFFGSSDGPLDQRSSLMRERLERAIAATAGITMKVSPSATVVTPGSKLNLAIKISNTGDKALDLLGCGSDIPALRKPVDSSTLHRSVNLSWLLNVTSIAPASTLNRSNELQFPGKIPINVPLPVHLYDPSGLGVELSTNCSVEVGDTHLNLESNTRVDVAPTVEIANITPTPFVLPLPKPAKPAIVRFQLINHGPDEIDVGVLAWTSYRKFTAQDCKFQLRPFEQRTGACVITGLEAPIQMSKNAMVSSYQVNLGLKNLKNDTLIGMKSFHAVWAGATVAPDLKVAYIRGFDYSLANALTALGVESKELTVEEVKREDLQQYSAIIVDNRVYESRPELIAANQRLLDYAKEGGTLIVFYHKANEWNPDARRNRPQLAPFPITLGDERVTDEDAPVTFLDSGHALLNSPNKLEPLDFKGWIQERGLYYPKEWAPEYFALLATNDPGEATLNGGLLAADYGRGHYIYSSMVWYRQLRAGVPGAYRMLANMISYGKTSP